MSLTITVGELHAGHTGHIVTVGRHEGLLTAIHHHRYDTFGGTEVTMTTPDGNPSHTQWCHDTPCRVQTLEEWDAAQRADLLQEALI